MLTTLPPDVIVVVAALLRAPDLCSTCVVSKDVSRLATAESVWRACVGSEWSARIVKGTHPTWCAAAR